MCRRGEAGWTGGCPAGMSPARRRVGSREADHHGRRSLCPSRRSRACRRLWWCRCRCRGRCPFEFRFHWAGFLAQKQRGYVVAALATRRRCLVLVRGGSTRPPRARRVGGTGHNNRGLAVPRNCGPWRRPDGERGIRRWTGANRRGVRDGQWTRGKKDLCSPSRWKSWSELRPRGKRGSARH